MATHSSVLAWGIPGMGEPGGLPSMGSHRVGHDWSDLAAAAKNNEGDFPDGPWVKNLPANARDRGSWWAAVSGVAQSQTRLKQVSSSSSSSLRTHNILNPFFPRKLRSLCFKLEYKTCIQIIMLQIKSDDYGQKITCQLLLAFRMIAVLSSLIVSRECIFLDSLSRHNKALEWRTLKPPRRVTALRSWIDCVIALRSQMDRVIALRQISVTAQCYSSILFRR